MVLAKALGARDSIDWRERPTFSRRWRAWAQRPSGVAMLTISPSSGHDPVNYVEKELW